MGAVGIFRRVPARTLSVLSAVAVAGALALVCRADWERPRTTRRCLQPPLSERMYTLFNDGKICFAEVLHEKGWGAERNRLEPSNVCWFFCDGRPLDFRTSVNVQPADGVPLHGLLWETNGVRTKLYACCDWGRRPVCHARFSVGNVGTSDCRTVYSMRLGSGSEWQLLGGTAKRTYAPDFYRSYASVPESWQGLTNVWTMSGRQAVSASGARLTLSAVPPAAVWNPESGELTFPVALAPGETMGFDFTLSFDESVEPACAATAVATRKRWRKELERIDRLPRGIESDPEKLRLVRNLTAQMLQCFARPKGKDYVLPRQGGQNRGVWPWDNMECLAALEEIGDFAEYVRLALDFYFDVCADDSLYPKEDRGRIGPFTIDWDQNTANVLGMLGRHCVRENDATCWTGRRARALEGFRWHLRKLVKPGTPNLKPGFMPPGRASDYKAARQSCTFTDAESIRSLIWFARAAERFDDADRDEIVGGFRAYAKALTTALEPYRRLARETGTFNLSRSLDDLSESGVNNNSYPCIAFVGLELGFFTAADIDILWRTWVRHGRVSAYGLAYLWKPKEDPHYWYTTSKDALWHHVLTKVGRRAEAQKILKGNILYAMTPEYCVGERYRDNDPWCLPWSPNVSGSGRIIQMLVEEEREFWGQEFWGQAPK